MPIVVATISVRVEIGFVRAADEVAAAELSDGDFMNGIPVESESLVETARRRRRAGKPPADADENCMTTGQV
ncbi:hypothetical protein PSAB6_230377 [Paraburkholderia sabiae]|nr:hypothetical protein PSAB6_230377 [Paraburkholderia sabiae]